MIVVQDLYDHDRFESILKTHFGAEKMTKENNIIPATDELLYCLAEKNYNIAKVMFNNTATVMHGFGDDSNIVEVKPDKNVVQEFKRNNDIDDNFYVFSGSRNSFAEVFELEKYSPSVAQFIIAGYEIMKSVKFVGPGKGCFAILKPFTNIPKSVFEATVASRADFYNNPKNQKHIIKTYQQDCAYYVDYIAKLQEENKYLNLQLQESAYKQYLQSQMTWS
jgi:hypothetical protein